MVALEPRPIKPKIVFGIADGFDEAKSVAPIPTIALAESITHFGGITNLTLSHTIAKDERANMVVEIGMERGTLILAQPEPTTTLATTTPIISYCNCRSKNRC